MTGLIAIGIGWPCALQAQGPADSRALAESLFRHGKKLMEQGAVREACPKFSESYRLDPTLGTLLNLAVCHEQEGKTATAWAEFHDASVRAARNGEKERATFARGRAAALEKRLSRLTIVVSAPIPGMEVRLDDRPLGEPAWGTAMPIDPGDHRIDVSGPEREGWSRTVAMAPGPEAQQIEVPPLKPRVRMPSPAPTVTLAAPASPAPPAAVTTRVPVSPEPALSTGWSARAVVGYLAGGLGVAGLGVGSYFGVRTLSQQKIVRNECDGQVCTEVGLAADRSAHSAARWSNVGFGVAAAGLGTAAYLWLTAPSAPSPSASWQIVPVAMNGPGITAGRRW